MINHYHPGLSMLAAISCCQLPIRWSTPLDFWTNGRGSGRKLSTSLTVVNATMPAIYLDIYRINDFFPKSRLPETGKKNAYQ